MSPPEKKHRRHRHLSSSATADVPQLGFSPFLRSLSHLPPFQKPTSSDTAPASLPLIPKALPRRHRRPSEDPLSSDDEEEDEEDDGSDGEEESGEGGVIQVDFGFFDPKPRDFHGVKLLLRQYLDDKPWDLSGFVDVILEQTTVGTVVKSDDGSEEGENRSSGGGEEEDGAGTGGDEGLYAVISALNLGRYESCKCLKEVKEYVLASCPDEQLKKELRLLLGKKANEVGLLVCERFVNFPDQAVPPLYNGLFDEIGWATEDEPTEELRDSFRFSFYLLITRVYMKKDAIQRKGASKASSMQKIGKCSNKRKVENGDDDSVVYIKAEDKIFHTLSAHSFTFDLQPGQPIPPEMKNYKKMGLVMVVESNKVPNFREKLNQITDWASFSLVGPSTYA